MKLLKYTKLYKTLIALSVFVVLVLPLITQAQTHDGQDSGITNFIQGLVWDLLTTIGGFLVWLGGKLLNYAINYYVVGFGAFYQTSGLGDSINSLWSIVRDIFNLTFIFGLVFIGFKLIFGDGSAKRTLGTLIMAALLVNFSLFITKFIIDFSNIAASQFANAFLIGSEYNVTEGFMRVFGLSSIFSTEMELADSAGWTYIFLTFFLFIIAAFVFAAGGILLIIRFVVLNIYMILSPIMFLGWVFPGFQGTSKQYWNGFLQRAFFAPAYVLMIYLSHQVLANMQAANGARLPLNQLASTNADAANRSFDQTIPLFLVSAIFLIASLIVAQKMGAQGATTALAIGKRASNKAKQMAGSSTFGLAAATGRQTVGRGASKLSNSATLNKWAGKSMFGAGLMKATRGVADSSFDGRRVAGLGKAAGLGEGRKGGYDSVVKEKNKRDAEFAKSLSTNKIERGFDGKIKGDELGKKQAQIDNDVANQKADIKTEYGYKAQVHSSAQKEELRLSSAIDSENQKQVSVNTEIVNLEKKLTTASLAERAELQKEIAAKKTELELSQNSTKNLATQLTNAKGLTKKAKEAEDRAYKAAVASAESKIEYANQLTFIARREKEAGRWKSGLATSGGAIGGASTGLYMGSAFGPAGMIVGATAGAVVGGIATRSVGARYKASAENMRKEYGTDGTNKKKKEREQANAKSLMEQIKEAGGDDAADKKEDKKDGD